MTDTEAFSIFATGTALGMLPWALAQSALVRSDTLQARVPAGPLSGEAGDPDGAPLRMLVLGDGSAIGGGCEHTRDSLAPRLAWGLAMRLRRRVRWRAVGGVGWTAARLDRQLQRDGVPAADVALVVIGFNDAISLTARADWRRDLLRLRGRLLESGVRLVGFSGLPRVHSLPRLGWPLGPLLEQRARQLDRILHELVDGLPLAADRTLLHLPVPAVRVDAHLAADGMHASAGGYAHWAERLAITLAAEWRVLPSALAHDFQQDRAQQQ